MSPAGGIEIEAKSTKEEIERRREIQKGQVYSQIEGCSCDHIQWLISKKMLAKEGHYDIFRELIQSSESISLPSNF